MTKTRYRNIHTWLQKKYGKANKCEGKACKGISKKFEWSKLHGKEHERKRENYQELCHFCHTKYDSVNKKKLNMKLKRTNIRVSAQALKRLRIASAKLGISIIELVDILSK